MHCLLSNMQTYNSNTQRQESVQTFNSNIQCKHSIRTFTTNIQFEYFTQTCNLAIFSANIIPSMFTPCPGANILGLLKSERRGKPNCVFFAFGVLCTCGINYFCDFYSTSKLSLRMFIAVCCLHYQGLVFVL